MHRRQLKEAIVRAVAGISELRPSQALILARHPALPDGLRMARSHAAERIVLLSSSLA